LVLVRVRHGLPLQDLTLQSITLESITLQNKYN